MRDGKTAVNCVFLQIYQDIFVNCNDSGAAPEENLGNIDIDKKYLKLVK